MRYLDWDVLLFPSAEGGANTNNPAAGAEAAHIPFREFKTQCQAETLRPSGDQVPLLSTFVPSLSAGAQFQISVHSWTRTPPVFVPGPDGHAPREMWEVRVLVDGHVETVAQLPVEGPWPQIISTANQHDGHPLDEAQPLRFPRFHSALQEERGWSASDGWGRIRVELSSGFLDDKNGGFLKMADIVSFAFQHAPLQILESASIAWPSPEMYHHPLPRQSPQMKSNIQHFGNAPGHAAHHPHRKMPSMGNVQLPMMGGGQQFNGPARHLQDYNTIDPSSRSTSAYSTLSASAGPIVSPTFNGQAPQQHVNLQGNGMRDGQYQFRLPSDQLAQIINALGASKQEPQSQPATNMPPPPLPAHVMTHFKNGIDGTPGGQFVPFAHKNQRSETDQHAINAFDRRAASNSGYSDVSMHANCGAFPHCIIEDPNGCLVHDSTVAPSSVVKSKKEGSSPTKPRDFFSVTLDAAPAASAAPAPQSQPMTMAPKDLMTNPHRSPAKEGMPVSSSLGLMSSSPADANGRKRTRSALKALNINNGGSPEKDLATEKPLRKASRASVSSVKSSTAMGLCENKNDKENAGDAFLVDHAGEGLASQEESMVLDA